MNYQNSGKRWKKSALVLMLPIVLLLVSCKTVKKNTETQTQTMSSVQITKSEHVQTIDSTRTNDSIAVHFTDTYYSTPDAAGRQYIKHVVQSVTLHTSTKQVAVKTVSDKKDNSTVQATQITKQKESITTKVKSPFALNLLAIAVGIVACVLAFFLVKKRKAIGRFIKNLK